MYVIKNQPYHYDIPSYCDFTKSCPIEVFENSPAKAQRFATVNEALIAIQRRAVKIGGTATGLFIERLTVAPGTTTRREVPLGTEGSKVAVKSKEALQYLIKNEHRSKWYNLVTYSVNDAQTAVFDSVDAALREVQTLDAKMYTSLTLVGVLEETTPETLTTAPLE